MYTHYFLVWIITFLVLPATALSQPLEPVSLCSDSPVKADRSGIISYNSSLSSRNCELTLNGFQNGDHITLVGLSSTPSTSCPGGQTNIQVNEDQRFCTSDDSRTVNIISVTDEQLNLKILSSGQKSVEIHYYHTVECGSDLTQLYPTQPGGLSVVFVSHFDVANSNIPLTSCSSVVSELPVGETVRFTLIDEYIDNVELTVNGQKLNGVSGGILDVEVPTNQIVSLQYSTAAGPGGATSGRFIYKLEVLTCGFPRIPNNTNQTLPAIPWLTGAVIQYSCESRYEVKEDNSNRTCEKSSESGLEWSSNDITCIPKKYCFDDPPSYSYASFARESDNKTATYQCEEGFISTQLPFTLSCESTEPESIPYNWTEPSEPLSCSRIICEGSPPTIENSQSQPENKIYYYEESFTYKCSEGYEVSGDQSVRCLSDGTWSEPPTCNLTSSAGTLTTKSPKSMPLPIIIGVTVAIGVAGIIVTVIICYKVKRSKNRGKSVGVDNDSGDQIYHTLQNLSNSSTLSDTKGNSTVIPLSPGFNNSVGVYEEAGGSNNTGFRQSGNHYDEIGQSQTTALSTEPKSSTDKPSATVANQNAVYSSINKPASIKTTSARIQPPGGQKTPVYAEPPALPNRLGPDGAENNVKLVHNDLYEQSGAEQPETATYAEIDNTSRVPRLPPTNQSQQNQPAGSGPIYAEAPGVPAKSNLTEVGKVNMVENDLYSQV